MQIYFELVQALTFLCWWYYVKAIRPQSSKLPFTPKLIMLNGKHDPNVFGHKTLEKRRWRLEKGNKLLSNVYAKEINKITNKFKTLKQHPRTETKRGQERISRYAGQTLIFNKLCDIVNKICNFNLNESSSILAQIFNPHFKHLNPYIHKYLHLKYI